MPKKVGERLVRVSRSPEIEEALGVGEKEIQRQREEEKFHEKRERRRPRCRADFQRTTFTKNKIIKNYQFIFLVIFFGSKKTETEKIIRNPESKVAEQKKFQNRKRLLAQQIRIIRMQRINRKQCPENHEVDEIMNGGSTDNYLHREWGDRLNFKLQSLL